MSASAPSSIRVPRRKIATDDFVSFVTRIRSRLSRGTTSAAMTTATARSAENCALQDALRSAEEHYRTIVETSHDLIWMLDAGERITFVNRRMLEATGYSRDQLLGRTLSEIVTGDGISAVTALLRNDGEETCAETEVRLQTKDGRRLILELTAVLVTTHGGTRSAICSGHDLTHRREAEEILRRTERSYQQLVDAVPGIVWSADASTVEFHVVSEKARDILGYEPADWLGNTRFWLDHLHPEDAVWVPQFCAEQTRRGVSHEFEYRMIAADGRIVWLHDIVNVYVENGIPVNLFGVMVDVTASKQTEIAVRQVLEERTRLATAIAAAGEAVIVTDAQGTIEYVNPAFETITGFSCEEAKGKTPSVLKSGRHPADFYNALWVQIAKGETWSGRIVNRRKDGTLYEAEATISPILSEAGSISGFVAVQRDVTEHVALLDKLRRAEEAEKFGRLVSGVAHEVRNPLGSIQAALGALELDLGSDPEHAPFFGIIRSEVRRLSGLMRELLELAKPLPQSQFEVCSISEMCASAVAVWRQSNPDQPPSRVVFRSETDGAIRMDAGRMQQVIINLLDNAVQHSPADSTVAITADESCGQCRVTIRDSGTGIGEAARARLFEPFFTTRKGGTGLGLSLARNIVEQHGGRVDVFNSEPPPGATAEIRVPFAATSGAITG